MRTQAYIVLPLSILVALAAFAVPALAAEDEEPKETVEQIERAQRIGKMLESRNKLEVTRGLRMLGEMKTPTAAELLMKFVQESKNVEHTTYAIDALGWEGNKKAVDFLCGRYGLKEKNILVGQASANALRSIGDRRAIPSLIEAIKGSKVVVVKSAIEAVVHLDPEAEGLADLMIRKMRDKDDWVRKSVAIAMGTLKDPKVVKALMRMAQRDSNSLVRLDACRSLGRLGSPKAAPTLEKVMARDKSQDVRMAARAAYDRCAAGTETADDGEDDE